ncbi:hypothetical protein [Streptomyces sp. NPDC096311]|uniref:hypothetical protein n=1 Tax=Streptomyces sp. NPDC096311 TaxID=3366083 RepID=UPI0037F80D6D
MNTMRAARAHRRQGPEQPAHESAPRPGPGGTVIVVRATSTTTREPARNATRADSLDGSGRERTPVIPAHEVSGAAAGATAPARAAKLTATASARDGEFVADLAAQNAIGHTESRFEDHVADVDVVRDTAGGDTHTRPWGLPPPGGALAGTAAPPGPGVAQDHAARAVFCVAEPDRDARDCVRTRAAYEAPEREHPRGKAVTHVADG